MFDKNHGLTPLKNADFLDFKKWSFLQSRKTSLLRRTSIIVISGLIFLKTRWRQNFKICGKNHGWNPLEYRDFRNFQQSPFYSLERSLFLSPASIIIISGLFLKKERIIFLTKTMD